MASFQLKNFGARI